MFLDSSAFVVRKTRWGRGVFARRELPAGFVIGDYLGVVDVPRDEGVDALYAMMLSLYRWVYPVAPKRSEGVHVVNHSCEPNAGIFPHRGHVLLSTTRRVFAGEEVTFDYWMTQPEPGEDWHPCLCGSSFCRGSFSMGSARQEELVRRLFISRAWAGARRTVRVGEKLAPLAKYPRSTRDLSAYNLYAHPKLTPVKVDDSKLDHARLRALIRETGRRVFVPRVGVTVTASHDGRLVAQTN